ncbi:HesA/MoeB/ThiF family protein [Bradyrhizobium sp. CCBAU 11361]|uniref:HesA/MoeB/ThiF family protein n=1 Tax=Bradyrhizobium sp. CCBAU 11361 TaxID=1630812 RepID=UPI002302094A|nr:ThiF family adenylyltransferase [Bradyrhizobium sp. CCBAU 11361]
MKSSLIFAGSSFADMKSQLLAASPREASCVVLANRGGPGRFLVETVVHAPEDAYETQSEMRIVLKPEFLAKPLKQARQSSQCTFFCHTHPFDQFPSFSCVDDRGEAVLMPAVFARVPGGPHGTLVLGQEGFSGRVYRAEEDIDALSEISEVSSVVKFFGIEAAKGTSEAFFDRNVRALGEQGQSLLRSLTIGIVGLGGTGSVIAQELAYLGVGKLVLIDDDVLEETNLNRVVGSGHADLGRSKVAVSADAIRRSGIGATETQAVEGSVLDQSAAAKLFECDFVFCCTDNHGSRMILNQIAYQYLLPTIDLGIRIDAEGGRIKAMAGRVQMLAPSLACLQCNGFLDPEMVRRDLMSDAERAADRYIVGDAQPQPAVISLNSTVSSLAVTMFLAAVAGFPMRARHQNYVIGEGTVRGVATIPLKDCIVCSSSRGALAKGDSWPIPWRSK